VRRSSKFPSWWSSLRPLVILAVQDLIGSLVLYEGPAALRSDHRRPADRGYQVGTGGKAARSSEQMAQLLAEQLERLDLLTGQPLAYVLRVLSARASGRATPTVRCAGPRCAAARVPGQLREDECEAAQRLPIGAAGVKKRLPRPVVLSRPCATGTLPPATVVTVTWSCW
jgi:hypothetical protein